MNLGLVSELTWGRRASPNTLVLEDWGPVPCSTARFLKEGGGADPLGCCAAKWKRARKQAWTLSSQAPLLLGLSGTAGLCQLAFSEDSARAWLRGLHAPGSLSSLLCGQSITVFVSSALNDRPTLSQ